MPVVMGQVSQLGNSAEVYIPQLFPKGGGIKPEDLGKNGEEIWYIRTFFHIFTQKWVNLRNIYLWTKKGDFRTSSTLSSLTTWLRRQLRKDQLGGTGAAFCTTKIDDFRASSKLSSLTTWLRRSLRRDQLGGTKYRYSPYI